jgi:hypothetical protein
MSRPRRINPEDYPIGTVFGRYKIIALPYMKYSNTKRGLIGNTHVACRCFCGTERDVKLNSLKSGKTVSCGCYNREVSRSQKPRLKHGGCGTRLHLIWKSMRRRCNNKNDAAYKHYGARGISVCLEWGDFSVFREWAVSNGYTEKLTIDRINVNGNYEPSNCRWATYETQANNKRSNIKYLHKGQMLTLPEIARMENIGFPTLYRRINENKLSLEDAISIPLGSSIKNPPKKVRQLAYPEDDGVAIIYDSPREASNYMGGDASFITHVCNGKYKQAYGYKWEYVYD